MAYSVVGQTRLDCQSPHEKPSTTSNAKPKDLSEPTSRTTLLASLRGTTIRIPDLASLFQHWPTMTNVHLDQMRADINKWLGRAFPPGRTLTALQAADFGLFGASWWPRANFSGLHVLTYLAVWLFTWDDEIDNSGGRMWDEFNTAQIYRAQTLSYVRYALEIDTASILFHPSALHPTILNFTPIGAAIKTLCTPEKRKLFYEELRNFVDMSEQEQRVHIEGAIPSLDEYWHIRLGTTAVTPLLVLIEVTREGTDQPLEDYKDEKVQSVMKCTNTLIAACNDLVSLRKEIVRLIVPVLNSAFYPSPTT